MGFIPRKKTPVQLQHRNTLFPLSSLSILFPLHLDPSSPRHLFIHLSYTHTLSLWMRQSDLVSIATAQVLQGKEKACDKHLAGSTSSFICREAGEKGGVVELNRHVLSFFIMFYLCFIFNLCNSVFLTCY